MKLNKSVILGLVAVFSVWGYLEFQYQTSTKFNEITQESNEQIVAASCGYGAELSKPLTRPQFYAAQISLVTGDWLAKMFGVPTKDEVRQEYEKMKQDAFSGTGNFTHCRAYEEAFCKKWHNDTFQECMKQFPHF